MKNRPYSKLKSLMYLKGITQKELAKETNKSVTYWTNRFRAMDNIYFNEYDIEYLCNRLDIPLEESIEYFYKGQRCGDN